MSTPAKKPPQNYRCAACGGKFLKQPQRNAAGGASHEICPACGFESGYTDDEQNETYESWREKWVSQGLVWFSKSRSVSKNWNAIKSLRSITHPRKSKKLAKSHMEEKAE